MISSISINHFIHPKDMSSSHFNKQIRKTIARHQAINPQAYNAKKIKSHPQNQITGSLTFPIIKYSKFLLKKIYWNFPITSFCSMLN